MGRIYSNVNNRFEVSTDTNGCSGSVFYGTAPAENALLFRFTCRAEEWLEAEGIKRKRRLRGKAEPARYSKVPPLPKPEPTEVDIPTTRVLVGTGVLPQPQPQPRSLKPLGYAGEAPQIQAEETHPASQPAGQEGQRCTPSEVVTPERPRKIPKLSWNTPFTAGSEGQRSAATRFSVRGGSKSKVKVEEDSFVSKMKGDGGDSVPQVKVEEGNSVSNAELDEGRSALKVKAEEGDPAPRIKVEERGSLREVKEEARGVTFNELDELKVCQFKSDPVPPVDAYPRQRKRS